MITLNNVKKPVYRAFELLHALGDNEVSMVDLFRIKAVK